MKYSPDFSSRFRILKGGKISLVVSALIAGSTMSFASPTGGQVTTGSATINQSGSVTTINQSSNKASINWNSFNIAPNETVNFVQPSASSVTLNRVIGTSRSLIEGAMNANGQVFLINPNGVLFANGSQINVGGLVASTLNITDENFQSGNYLFEGNSQNSIINMGTITSNNGYIAMMGKTVQNEGTIVATMGNVQMASGEKISLNLNGNSLVKLTIDQGTLNALVENKGLIKADGGQVYLTTQALNTILDGMVNNTGIIEAQTLGDITGKVVLFAHGGTANIGGSIDASSGFVETSGKKLGVADSTVIKAKTWLLDPDNITIDWNTGATDLTTVPGTSGDVSVDTAAITTALEAGTNVSLEATYDITLNTNITKTTGSDATLTLKAGNNIINDQGWSIWALTVNDGGVAGNGKLNVVLWADSDGDGHGGVQLDSGSWIQTLGGDVWIGGGSGTTTWNGLTVGDSVVNGVLLNSAVIKTGTEDESSRGDVKIASKGWNGGVSEAATLSSSNTQYQVGIILDNSAIYAKNLTINSTSENSDGVVLKGNSLLNGSAAGAINVQGTSTAGGYGIWLKDTMNIFGIGTTTLTGTANDATSSYAGIFLDGNDVLFNGAGTSYTLTGNAVGGLGINFAGAKMDIYATDITLNGTSSTNDGLYFSGASKIWGKNLTMNGIGSQVSGSAEGFKSVNRYNEFQSQSGDVTISATGGGHGIEAAGIFAADTGAVSITGTGQNGYGVYLGSDGVTTIGTSYTDSITINGTSQGGDFAGVYTDSNYATSMKTNQVTNNGFIKIIGTGHGLGAGVNIGSPSSRFEAGSGAIPSVAGATGVYINGTAGAGGVGVNLKGYYFAKYGGVTVKGTGGASAANGAGAGIVLDGAYIGRKQDSVISPWAILLDGTALGGNNSGIYADENSVASKIAWGWINGNPPSINPSYAKLIGQGHGDGYGIELNNANTNIEVGDATIPNTTMTGLYISGIGGATGGGVKLTGYYEGVGGVSVEGTTGASATNGKSGVLLTNVQLFTDGEIKVIGVANNSAGDNYGVYLNNAGINSDGGSVTVDGTGHGTGYGIYILNEATSANSSTSSIRGAGGAVTLIGRGKTGTGYNINQYATQDTLDNSTGMYNNGALDISSDTGTYLNGGGGSIWLGNTSNDFGYENVNAANVVDLRLNDGSYGLKLGEMTTTGKIDISTMDGSYADITIYENITTTSTASDAIVINSGIDQVAGTIGTANIIYDGGTITAGTGATIKLFTGSYNDSTDLTTLVGTGNGHYRYNSDETTTLSPVIGTGMYAIYREAYASGYESASSSSGGGSSGGGSGGETPTPVDPTQQQQQTQVNDIVTTIVNSTTVTQSSPIVMAPLAPQPSLAQTQSAQLIQNIIPQAQEGEHFNLVGMTDGLIPVQTVNMEQLQKVSDGQGINEIRVSLAQDSIVELINGGVHLPNGVLQEFYVIADNTQQDNK